MMRSIDRFIGIPVCLIIGWYRKFFRRKRTRNIERILIIKFFGMGSIILSTPAISLLRNTYPNAHITFLSFHSNKELLERIPIIDTVITINTSTISSFISTTLILFRHLHSQHYDVVFDFEFFSKYSTALSGLSGAPVRIGFELPTRWRKIIVTDSVILSKEQHVTRAFCDQIFTLTEKLDIPDIVVPRTIESDISSMQAKVILNDANNICINVNAGETFLERRWPPEYFAKFVSNLSGKSHYNFYFIGSESERSYVQGVINQTTCPERCQNLGGLLTVPELMALLQKCDILISNDSGPLHLASALGTPVLGLYGPETPVFYGPAGNIKSATIYRSIECSPCMNVYDSKTFTCPYNARCMKEISVKEVEQACSKLIAIKS